MTAAVTLKEQLRALKSLAGPFEPFDLDGLPDDPRTLFAAWLLQAIARNISEAHAMTLSSVDADGLPDARVLILKDVDAQGWHFASSRLSPKGCQIADRPQAALTFYWQPLGRQVRLRGPVVEQSADISAADFLARPIGARAAALLVRQSDVLDCDGALEAGLTEQAQRLAQDPALVAPTWAVYALQPRYVEFWQADEARKHRRLRYARRADEDDWTIERLWP